MSFPKDPADKPPDPDSQRYADQGNNDKITNSAGDFRSVVLGFFKNRRSTFRAWVYGSIAGFFIASGSFYYNNRHAAPWLAVVLFFIGGMFASITANQALINRNKSDRFSQNCALAVFAAFSLFAGMDLYFEYRQRAEPSLSDIHKAVTNMAALVSGERDKNLPRHLTDGQLTSLVAKLKLIPKERVELKAVQADVEASKFRDELGLAFISAGFSSSGTMVIESPDVYPEGVTVVEKTSPTPNPVVLDLVKEALTSVGVEVSSNRTHSDAIGNRLFIFVGPKPTLSASTAPDYVPGTKVTHAEIENEFPFGYVVVSFRDGNRIFDPRLREDQLKIEADWKHIQITPDFASRTAEWAVTIVSMTIPSKPESRITNLIIRQRYPMEVGMVYLWPGLFGEKSMPRIHFATLSDNQASPVFLMGFRIPQKSSPPN